MIIPRSRWPGVPAILFLLTACGGRAESPSPDGLPGPSVWAVDLVRTLPGAQADYLASIEANWAGARRLAVEAGKVRSYRALAMAPDMARGWDVLLMTEYPDSAAYLDRETTFQAIFASPEFVRVEPARPSAEMREFASGDLAMREVAAGSVR